MLSYAQATLDGATIHYATEGAGPPLLLLHGLGLDHRVWAGVAPYLVGHARVIIPDLPGCGRSRAAAWDGEPEAWLRTVATLLTATQAVPAYVAGVGLGGALALLLAVRYPERVRALVVVGAPVMQTWPGTATGRLGRAALGVPGAAGLLAGGASGVVAGMWLRAALSGAPEPAHIAQLAAALRDRQERQSLLAALRRLPAWATLQRKLGAVRAPTLLLWGERDRLYGLPAAERLRHAIPGAQLATLAGAGHLLPLERPADLAAGMRQFYGMGARPARR